MGNINNYSEIAPLKKVLLNRPGEECLHMSPFNLPRLYFDGIPYMPNYQKDHDIFADALRSEGVEVVYSTQLFGEAMDAAPKGVREKFIKQYLKEGGVTDKKIYNALYDFLDSIKDNRALGAKVNAGTHISELEGFEVDDPYHYYRSRDRRGQMLLDPLPNSFAPRDPIITVGHGAILPTMWSSCRKKETILFEYIFKYHPLYKNTYLYYGRNEQYTIEGGDVQVMNEETVIIGASQRTEPEAIELFAKNLFNEPGTKFNTVIAFDMPDESECMHLDTVMTRVDYNKFAVVKEVADVSRFFILTKDGKNVKIVLDPLPLEEILKKYLHLKEVEFILCGNGNTMDSERERFSDGCNFLCIRPGVVIGYDRNFTTNKAMREHGVKVIEIPSAELINGRGGPHCMSMALVRENDKSTKAHFE